MRLGKIIIHNILACKKLSALLLITLIVNSSLLYCILSIHGELKDMFINEARTDVGTSDLRIYPGRYSKSANINLEKIEETDNDYEYVVSLFFANAYYEMDDDTYSLPLYGTTLDEINIFSTIVISEEEDSNDIHEFDIAISDYTKEKYDLILGDNIKVKINNQSYNLHISKILEQVGYLSKYEDRVFINKSTLQDIYALDNKQVSNIFVKLWDDSDERKEIEKLEVMYPDYVVEDSVQMDTINAYVNRIMGAMFIIFLFSFIMSVMILTTTYRLLFIRRLSELITLRCLGLSKKNSCSLVLLEGSIYGLLGGVLGGIVGIFIFRVVIYYIQPVSIRKPVTGIVFDTTAFIITILVAVVFSILITTGMVKRMKKISLKNLLFNGVNEVFPMKTTGMGRKIGVMLCILTFLLLNIMKFQSIYILLALSLLVVILMYKNLSYVFALVTGLISLLVGKWKKGMIYLSLKNVESNPHTILGVSLIALGVSCIYVIQLTSNNVLEEIINRYKEDKYQLEFSCNNNNEDKLDEIKNIKNVTDIMPSYYLRNIDIQDICKVQMIQGIGKEDFSDFFEMANVKGWKEYLVDEEKERNIFVSSLLSETYNIIVGDTIELELGEKTYSYEVCGIMNTNLYAGSYALISQYNIINDFEQSEYSSIYIKVKPENLSAFKKEMRIRYLSESMILIDISDEKDLNYRSNANKFMIVRLFILTTFAVGVIGIINTTLLSFEGRKKEFSIMLSIGMSQKKLRNLVVFENLSVGFVSGIIAIITCKTLTKAIPSLISRFGFNIRLDYGINESILCVISCVVIAGVFSIIWISKVNKLSVIENIKGME